MEVGEEGDGREGLDYIPIATLSPPRNDLCIITRCRAAPDESHFKLIMFHNREGQSHKTVSTGGHK